MKSVAAYFNSLSLKKQFIVSFLITTLMTLIVSIVVMKIQIKQLKDSTNLQLDQLNNADYVLSTTLTAKTIKSSILSYFFELSKKIDQLHDCYHYFTDYPQVYVSS